MVNNNEAIYILSESEGTFLKKVVLIIRYFMTSWNPCKHVLQAFRGNISFEAKGQD